MTNDSLIIHKDLEFLSSCDGLAIKYDIYYNKEYQSFLKQDSCKFFHSSLESQTFQNNALDSHDRKKPCIIQIAHGMVEHKERYIWLCTHLAKVGYIAAIHDHRGHGKSIDANHSLGEMQGIFSQKVLPSKNEQESLRQSEHNPKLPQTSGFYKAIKDMHTLTHILKQSFSYSSFILLGHSMGSLLSRAYLHFFMQELDALVLSGSPAFNPLLKFGISLAKFLQMCHIESGKYLINALSFNGFNKSFAKEVQDSEYSTGAFAWLSRDKNVVNAYKADKACQFVFSLQSFIDLFEGTLFVQNPLSSKNDTRQRIPIFIISGANDSCGNFGKGVKEIAQNFEQYGFHVTLRLYEDARHEIFQEINKQEILQDLLQWLKPLQENHHL